MTTAWGRRGSWKRKKKRNESNCEKSGGGLSETGHNEEGRVDSHGPDLSFFCPALVSVCARAGSGYVEVAAESILHSIRDHA